MKHFAWVTIVLLGAFLGAAQGMAQDPLPPTIVLVQNADGTAFTVAASEGAVCSPYANGETVGGAPGQTYTVTCTLNGLSASASVTLSGQLPPTDTPTPEPTPIPQPTSEPTATPLPTPTPGLITPPGCKIVASGIRNLHSLPSTASADRGELGYNDLRDAVGFTRTLEGDWYRIEQSDGTRAWVAASGVVLGRDCTDLPFLFADGRPSPVGELVERYFGQPSIPPTVYAACASLIPEWLTLINRLEVVSGTSFAINQMRNALSGYLRALAIGSSEGAAAYCAFIGDFVRQSGLPDAFFQGDLLPEAGAALPLACNAALTVEGYGDVVSRLETLNIRYTDLAAQPDIVLTRADGSQTTLAGMCQTMVRILNLRPEAVTDAARRAFFDYLYQSCNLTLNQALELYSDALVFNADLVAARERLQTCGDYAAVRQAIRSSIPPGTQINVPPQLQNCPAALRGDIALFVSVYLPAQQALLNLLNPCQAVIDFLRTRTPSVRSNSPPPSGGSSNSPGVTPTPPPPVVGPAVDPDDVGPEIGVFDSSKSSPAIAALVGQRDGETSLYLYREGALERVPDTALGLGPESASSEPVLNAEGTALLYFELEGDQPVRLRYFPISQSELYEAEPLVLWSREQSSVELLNLGLAWSPTGDQIYVTVAGQDDQPQIARLPFPSSVENGALTQGNLDPVGRVGTQVDVAPNGQIITYVRSSTAYNLGVSIDGLSESRIYPPEDNLDLCSAADADYVSTNFHIVINCPRDGRPSYILYSAYADPNVPAGTPGSERITILYPLDNVDSSQNQILSLNFMPLFDAHAYIVGGRLFFVEGQQQTDALVELSAVLENVGEVVHFVWRDPVLSDVP